jgi:hypothetical protein
LSEGKVVGLVTIRPNNKPATLQKNIWKYKKGMQFLREGSMSVPHSKTISFLEDNNAVVNALENHAQNNIKLTLDGVMDFINRHQGGLMAQYKVFKELFVVCWSGLEKQVKGTTFYSRVDIELINEQVKLFYSNLDEVEISFSENEFIITEYIELGINGAFKFYPLEEVRICFEENGNYAIHSKLLFKLPNLDKKTLHHLMNSSLVLVDKIKNEKQLNVKEEQEQYVDEYKGTGNPRTDEAYDDIEKRARKRYKKLIEDALEVETRHLNTLTEGLAKQFKLHKETVKTSMETFGGTIEELYIHVKRNYI